MKKGIKSVKSSPEAYLAGAGLVVGGAAVLLLATTKSGQELLARTAQLALHPGGEGDEAEEADVQEEEAQNKPPEDADAEDEPEEESDGDEESEVRDLKPRNERAGSPRKASAPRKASSA